MSQSVARSKEKFDVSGISVPSCSNGIKSQMCLVGPAEAAELLKLNIRNRRIAPGVVNRYAAEMSSGDWKPTSSGIGIGSDGVLTDGQQRLMAILVSKQTIPLLITTGLPPESQEKIDRQRKRSLFDVFYLSGVCQNKHAVQVATFLAARELKRNTEHDRAVSDSEVRRYIEAHRTALLAIAEQSRGHRRVVNQVGVRAAMTLAYEPYKEKAIQFFHQVQSDIQPDEFHPAYRLRKSLEGETIRRTVSQGGGQQLWAFRRTVYAFNAYITGKGVTAIREANEIISPS